MVPLPVSGSSEEHGRMMCETFLGTQDRKVYSTPEREQTTGKGKNDASLTWQAGEFTELFTQEEGAHRSIGRVLTITQMRDSLQ